MTLDQTHIEEFEDKPYILNDEEMEMILKARLSRAYMVEC